MTKAVAVTTINAASGEQVERAYGLLMSDVALALATFSDAWGALEPLYATSVDHASKMHLACAGALTGVFHLLVELRGHENLARAPSLS